jgi:hypothetical protein
MNLRYLLISLATFLSLHSNAQTALNALNFDGSNDHVVISSTIPYSSNFTLEVSL